MDHLLGYARVSTTDQQPQLQVDALKAAGCYWVFTETASGARTDRPTLEQLLDQLRPGDTLVVWKPDRLGRSLRHLVDTVTGLVDRGVGFRSLQEAIDTTTPGGKLVLPGFGCNPRALLLNLGEMRVVSRDWSQQAGAMAERHAYRGQPQPRTTPRSRPSGRAGLAGYAGFVGHRLLVSINTTRARPWGDVGGRGHRRVRGPYGSSP